MKGIELGGSLETLLDNTLATVMFHAFKKANSFRKSFSKRDLEVSASKRTKTRKWIVPAGSHFKSVEYGIVDSDRCIFIACLLVHTISAKSLGTLAVLFRLFD